MKELGQGATYLLFRFFLALAWLVSRIPGIRYLLALLISNVFGYRKKVVTSNLKRAFPQASEDEIQVIRGKFYSYFSGLFLEHLQGKGKGKDEWKRLVLFPENNLLEQYALAGKTCFVLMGHTGNWEWAGLRASFVEGLKMATVYKPQRNRRITHFLVRQRSKFGMLQVPMNEVARFVVTTKEPYALTFLADQSGPQGSPFYADFFGQHTSFFGGWASLATKYRIPILYAGVHSCPSPHMYRVDFKCMWDGSTEVEPQALVQDFARMLEADICQHPSEWLWSHKRWKWIKPKKTQD